MNEKDNDIERMLLSNASLDDLIKAKIEKEFTQPLKNQQPPRITKITDISKVPSKLIFSKDAVYRLYNRNSKTQTYINGLQAEALLGEQESVRGKMLKGETSSFATEDAYIKFEKVTVRNEV